MFVVHVKLYYMGNPDSFKNGYDKENFGKSRLSVNKVRFPKEDTKKSCVRLIIEDYETRVKRGKSCNGHWAGNKFIVNYVTATGGIYKGKLSIKSLESIPYSNME
jgi:hypothetical protein